MPVNQARVAGSHAGQPGQAVVLGVNRDAIPVITQPKFADVMSDDWGGENGVPSDAQYMGAIAVIQLSLIKFNLSYIDRLMTGAAHYTGGWNTAGEGFPFGGLIRAGGLMGQLVLNSALCLCPQWWKCKSGNGCRCL